MINIVNCVHLALTFTKLCLVNLSNFKKTNELFLICTIPPSHKLTVQLS